MHDCESIDLSIEFTGYMLVGRKHERVKGFKRNRWRLEASKLPGDRGCMFEHGQRVQK